MSDDKTNILLDTSKFTVTPHFIIMRNPKKDDVPCWFWRKMQWLCFGNKWVKK
jgi:hypothetical protein